MCVWKSNFNSIRPVRWPIQCKTPVTVLEPCVLNVHDSQIHLSHFTPPFRGNCTETFDLATLQLGVNLHPAPYLGPHNLPKLSHYLQADFCLPGESSLFFAPNGESGDWGRGLSRVCPNPAITQPIPLPPPPQDMLRNDRLPEFEARSPMDDRSPPEQMISSPRHSAQRPPLRVRPQTWHPYGPVEPPLETSSPRSIGVHAILNPTSQGLSTLEKTNRREKSSRPSIASSARPRQTSSPAPQPGFSLASQPLSPKSLPRAGRALNSPSLYYVGPVGTTPSARSSTAQPPSFLSQDRQQQQQQPPHLNSSAMLHDSTLRPVASSPVSQPLTRGPLNSPPSIHAGHVNAGSGPRATPNGPETSPSTPQSIFSHVGRASPAVASMSLPPCATTHATPAPPTYPSTELGGRAMSVTAGPPHSSTPEENPGAQGMIPCVLDLKSGSSTQAEKRKANSDASRRFRNRKRNEMQLEQRLSAQQEEIQRQAETIRRQAEEIQFLANQRDYYRSERNFFRETLERLDDSKYPSQRPLSPRPMHLNVVPGMDTPKSGTAPSPPSVKREPAPMRPLESVRSQSDWGVSDVSPSFASPVGPGPVPPNPPRLSGNDISPRADPTSVAGVALAPLQKSWSRP